LTVCRTDETAGRTDETAAKQLASSAEFDLKNFIISKILYHGTVIKVHV